MTDTATRAKSAVAWAAAFSLYRDVLQFGTMLVLVRLIEPSAYGQFAQTTAMVGFIAVFSFNNFVAYTLQPREIAPVDYQIHFTAGAVLQGFAFLLTNIVAFWMSASETGFAEIANPVHLASIGFLLEWPCELRRRMLEREYRWRRLNVLHAVGIFISTAVGLALGLAGFGVYALVGPGLLQTVPFIWDLFFAERWRPDWSWSWRSYAAASRFGLKRTASAIAIAGRSAVESMVLGAVLGYQLLGIFNRAMGLVQLLCMKPASIIGTAVYPMLPRLAGESASRSSAADLLLRTVGWIAVPTAVAAGLLARPIVVVLYGDRWLDVIPLLPWAMAYGATFAMVYTANLLMVAAQRVFVALLIDLYLLAATTLGLWLALPQGAAAYVEFLFAGAVVLLLVLAAALDRLNLATRRGLVHAFAIPVLAATAAAAAAWPAIPLSAQGGLVLEIGHAIFAATLFAITYVVVIRVFFAQPLRELVEYLPANRAFRKILVFRNTK